MTDTQKIGEILQRAANTNARFYAGLAELSIRYVQSVSEIFTTALATSDGASQPVEAPPSRPSERPPEGSSTLVLEGVMGSQVSGHFLVENKLPREVTAKPSASLLLAEDGTALEQRVSFEPNVIPLGPHERVAVQVSVEIDETVNPDKSYHGSITVPGLAEGTAGLVVRRLDTANTPPEVDEPAPVIKEKSSRAARRGKDTASQTKKKSR